MTKTRAIVVGGGVVAVLGSTVALAMYRGSTSDGIPNATAQRQDLRVMVAETGILRPARSLTYRSPLAGREVEVTFLAPEGTYVAEGDLIAQLDTSELARDLERATQTERQSALDERLAVADEEDAHSGVDSASNGEKAIELEDIEAKLALMQRKVARLRAEHDGLEPLLVKGYITKDELDRSAMELEQAQVDADATRRRATLIRGSVYPREQRRAQLLLEQRRAQVESARERHRENSAMIGALRTTIDACRIYAKQAGLVVHEELISANPRRKVRVGDRVTVTQGLVTIPDLDHMLLDTSVRESDVGRLRVDQPVLIAIDAFPSARFSGRVAVIGALGRTAIDRPFEEKRFDVTIGVDGVNRQLRPEMTARAAIVVTERRQALVVPVSAIFDRGGHGAVYVQRHWRYEQHDVQTGESNDSEVEVIDGLVPGDRVALTDPYLSAGAAPRRP